MLFERFADTLDYPMFVVTAIHPVTGERSGCLVGFASQCGMEPVRFLVCVSAVNHTHKIALASPVLAVHALGERQRALAALFGERTGDRVDKFAHCAWEPGPAGVPLLTDCPVRIVGTVLHRLDRLGDHTGFVLAPIEPDAGTADAGPPPEHHAPLMFSAVRDLHPGHPA
ncbi:flavin reductase family protein [Embleya sp. NPDC059237]|uniref:flavin reductase family protein n=1 Tax=Embleya sp. NPDC059237 TaxID=3346784 RepID=UPI0036C6872B